MTQDQVAEEMDWSLSKLIRVESGAVGISTNDLRALLQLYGVTDRRRTNEMIDLAKAARQRMWWNEYRQYMSPQFMTYVGFEAEAVVVRQFHLTTVPGLLQTEAYARSIMDAGDPAGLDDEATEAQVAIRAERGRQVLDRDDPPALHLILDESTIRRQIGGPAVMRDQLTRVLEAAKRPNVTLQVVPFERGAYPGIHAAFTIYEFGDPAVGDVLYLGGPGRDELRESPSDVEFYRKTFANLEEVALSVDDSLDLIGRAQQEFP